jgi:hypothetical protein
VTGQPPVDDDSRPSAAFCKDAAHDGERRGMPVLFCPRELPAPARVWRLRLRVRVAVPAGAAVCVALLAGCSGSSGLDASAPSATTSAPAATSASPTPTPSASTTPPAPSATVDPADAAVHRAWDTYYAAFTRGIRTRNERVPGLIRYATDRQQGDNNVRIRTMRARGYRTVGRPHDWFKDVTVVGPRASLRYCEFDSSIYYVDAAGNKVIPVKDKWNAHRVRLVRRDGVWQVDSVDFAKFSCKGAT